MSTDQDQLSRQKISENIHCSYFVEAGAGSGKTTQLVKRMVSLVIQGTDIRHICAITFTKAAAREFYSRFQAELARIINETDDDKVRRRCDEAIRNIDLCFMGTIDSFSELILREHPVEAGIPSDFTVCPESDMETAYRHEYSNIIRGYYGKELQEKYIFFRKFHSEHEKVFIKGFSMISGLHNTEIVFDRPESHDIDQIFSKDKEELIKLFECIFNNRDRVYIQGKTSKNPYLYLDKLDDFKPDFEILKHSWNGMISGIPKLINKMDKFRIICPPEQIGITLTSLFIEKKNYYSLDLSRLGLSEKIRELNYSASMDFLVSSVRMVNERLLKKGELTFFESKLCLRNMLKKDAENGGRLIRHIADRHRFFLIDEFQDTDPMQSEIFFYLAAENPVPDWRKCVPRKGSLFIVGDPKQSIYRFRSADIGAFTKVRKLFKDDMGEVLELTRNYRSTIKMQKWFNNTFTKLLPYDTEYQSRFELIPVEGENDDELFSGVYSYRTDPDNDAQKVCDIIKKLTRNPLYTVLDYESKKPRNLNYSDFMIITPEKLNIGNYMSVLGQAGIPCYVEGKSLFKECPALTAMSDILGAAAYPNDSMIVYSALKSDLFAIKDEEIAAFRPRITLYGKNCHVFEQNEHIKHAYSVLTELNKRSEYMTFSALFSYVLDDLKLLEFTGTDNLECLYYALELIRSAESSCSIVSAQNGADFLRSLITDGSQERSLSFEKTSDRVHIANLHKVKGLEANVVILADPIRKPKRPSLRTEYSDESEKSYIFSCKVSGEGHNYPAFSSAKYEAQLESEKSANDAEEKRLLYVAATRAKSALIVADARNKDGEKSKDNPWESFVKLSNGSIFDDMPAVQTQELTQAEEVTVEKLYSEPVRITENSSSAKNSYTIARPSQIKLKSVTAESDDLEDNSNNEVRKKDVCTDAALVGTMVHKLMESIVSAEIIPDAESLALEIVKKYEASEMYCNTLKVVYNKIMNGGYPQQNSMPADILSELKNSDEVQCEVPFCHKVKESDGSFTLWHGVIDLLYKKHGKWHIVDYKTNAEAAGLNYKYSAQLNAYKAAFKAVTGETAEVSIYHIDV